MRTTARSLALIAILILRTAPFDLGQAAAQTAPSPAQGSPQDLRSLNDHLAARKANLSGLLSGKSSVALSYKDAVVGNGADRANIYVTPGQDTFTVSFAANPRGGPRASGDYLVRRNAKSGYLVEIEIVLSDGGNDFVRIRSLDANRSALDLYQGGAKTKSGVALGLPLYYLLVEPFSKVMDLAGSRVAWPATTPPAPAAP